MEASPGVASANTVRARPTTVAPAMATTAIADARVERRGWVARRVDPVLMTHILAVRTEELLSAP
jgi:hypothetical protein